MDPVNKKDIHRQRFSASRESKSLQSLIAELSNTKGITKKIRPKPGDVLGVNRELSDTGISYEHFSVYTEKDTVIHYTSLKPNFDMDLEIMETSMEFFLKTDPDFFILEFDHLFHPIKISPELLKLNVELKSEAGGILDTLIKIWELIEKSQIKIYSPEETVARARSRLGEKEYSLLLNNCEHFAIWCKTGLQKSYQIDKLIKVLKPKKGLWRIDYA